MAPSLPHLSADGSARMVDVSGKDVTVRRATAAGRVLVSVECLQAVREGDLPKGDALGVARIAGIQGAKKTPDLVPLCHPVGISGVDVVVELGADAVEITATVSTNDRTGVEMEALTAVCVAGLAVIDMVKAVDREAVLSDVRVLGKTGGRRGDWQRGDRRPGE